MGTRPPTLISRVGIATIAHIEHVCDSSVVPNESPAQRRASRLRENKQRCHEAAGVLRHRVNQGLYAGMRGPAEGYVMAALLEAAGFELDQLTGLTARAVLASVDELLDDAPTKPGAVAPITSGDGF